MPHPLDYGIPRQRRLPTKGGLFIALDLFALAYGISQWAFLLAMMIINIRETNGGSSYTDNALGNADFVRSHPGLAAWIGTWNLGWFEAVGTPAMMANMLTLSIYSYLVVAYLVYRVFKTRRTMRIALGVLTLIMLVSLLYIHPAMVVRSD